MKTYEPRLLVEFKFSGEQKTDLLNALRSKARPGINQSNALRFLEACERSITIWCHISKDKSPRGSEIRQRMLEVQKKAVALKRALERLPVEFSTTLLAEMEGLLVKSVDPDVIENSLEVVITATGSLINYVNDKGGDFKPYEIDLIKRLAGDYQSSYGERPPYSKGTPFVQYVLEIAGFLDVKISPRLIENTLKSNHP